MRSCSAARDRVQHVRRGDEEHLAQVVLDVEIVIDEHVVLFGIEHFEQRRRQVTAESIDILSISSSMKTGFRVPAFFMY
jgi:hypothetical protein